MNLVLSLLVSSIVVYLGNYWTELKAIENVLNFHLSVLFGFLQTQFQSWVNETASNTGDSMTTIKRLLMLDVTENLSSADGLLLKISSSKYSSVDAYLAQVSDQGCSGSSMDRVFSQTSVFSSSFKGRVERRVYTAVTIEPSSMLPTIANFIH